MAHEFMILRNGQFETYSNYDDIPLDFDHIIKFLPEIPLNPHTEEQHSQINEWNEKFKRLIAIERENLKHSNNNINE